MDDAASDLDLAVSRWRRMSERLTGLAEQIAEGEWDLSGLDESELVDLAALFEVAAERARFTRVLLPDPSAGIAAVTVQQGVESSWLPLNRKERYYTGTVLPMIVASDGFVHLHRLLGLCGLVDVTVEASTSLEHPAEIAFFTEYGFAESVFTDADRGKWPDLVDADTPDVVIAGPDWLVAIEAKMFHNPSAKSLERQMDRQRALIDYWARQTGLEPHRVRHVLLLPEDLARRVRLPGREIVTWEQVLESYHRVAPRYWVQVLRTALARYRDLRSRPSAAGGRNAAMMMTGESIVELHARGELEYDHVGRSGGASGKLFAGDIAADSWRTTRYEVRTGPLPDNHNWFPISHFIAATAVLEADDAGETAP